MEKQKPRLLFITNMFPTERFPVLGIFVKEQVDDVMSQLDCEADIIYINAREKGKLEYLKSIFSIPQQIRKGKYDVIHIHYGLSALFMLFFKPRSKVFLTLHGADILIKQKKRIQVLLTKKIVHKVNKVFILNKEMEEIADTLHINYEMLPCGVNIDFFKPNGHHKKETKSKLVVFPGSPQVEVKNFPLFQQTIQELSKTCNEKVDFACIQNMSRAAVKDLLNKADCLLMTSISEGSPQVIKEALACGLPVVSVPVGDVKNMIEGVPYCYISKTYSPEELSHLVLQAFEGTQHAADIRTAFVNKKIYDSHAVAQRLVTQYTAPH